MTTAQTAVYVQSATLSTTTADTVTFSGHGKTLAVTNRDSTNTLYFTIDGTTTAVAAADECFAVLPLQTFTLSGGPVWPVLSVVGSGGGYTMAIH
jgi:hypothetical protein